jgi:tRNA (adenine57-N1/adenine58-N1)-methyltransferase
MYETLLRPHEVNAVPTLPSVREAADRLRNSEQKREEKRQRQIAGSRHFKSSAPQGAGKRKREEGPKDEESSACRALDIKRVRPSEVAISADLELMALQDAASLPRESHEVPLAVDAPISHPVTRVLTPAKVSVSKASPDVRGHTSYLTFACLVPKPSVPTQTDANLNVHATIETDGTPDTCEI